MKINLYALLTAGAAGVLTACAPPQPPTNDDVRAARQDWYQKEHAGDFTLTSLTVSNVSCKVGDGSKFICLGHEAYETAHKAPQVGPNGTTVMGVRSVKGEDDFNVTLVKNGGAWMRVD